MLTNYLRVISSSCKLEGDEPLGYDAELQARSAPQHGELGPIVSSAHLATGLLPSLSELEFGLILLGHAFNRWMVRCAAASGVADLSALEVLVLHTVNHRARAKRLADICLVLNVEDTHLVHLCGEEAAGARPRRVRPPRQGEDGHDYSQRRGPVPALSGNPRGAVGETRARRGGGRTQVVGAGWHDACIIRAL